MNRPGSKQKSNSKPDFEGNLADFDAAFLLFVVESDPNFDVTLLHHNPTPSLLTSPATHTTGEVMHPVSKEALTRTIALNGPLTINQDIFAEQVWLECEIRVKGNIYGAKEVQIGNNCVIEGDVISDGTISIQKGCRVEGALVGSDLELEGLMIVDGPVYSRGGILCRGSLTAQSLTAEGNIVFLGDSEDEVSLEAALMLARRGQIQIGFPLRLAGQLVDLKQQKFYIAQNGEQLRLSRVPFESTIVQSALLTTLTDSELEKLVADLGILE
ncbi:MAG: polymer-forming cytoskeletal protein [Chloroflexota bacterium]|nr:polymer-forming cytoskeletal protein [Chloroflexota bacterium]